MVNEPVIEYFKAYFPEAIFIADSEPNKLTISISDTVQNQAKLSSTMMNLTSNDVYEAMLIIRKKESDT